MKRRSNREGWGEVKKSFIDLGRELKSSTKEAGSEIKDVYREMVPKDTHAKCPYCGSQNTNLDIKDLGPARKTRKQMAAFVFLPLAIFVGNKKITNGECFDCSRKWAIN